jgi:hypothetical protein
MDESQPVSPRARLQELLAIPERQRTDAEWDEINELEISLAAGNRPGAPIPGMRGPNPQGGGGGGGGGGGRHHPGGGGPHRGKKQGRKFHHRPPKRNGP